MLSGIDIFRVTADRMRYLTQRQAVISRNIANADTPGYKALDLPSFAPAGPSGGEKSSTGPSSPLVLARTQAGASGSGTAIRQPVASSLYGEKPNGNTVSLEEQMVKSTDIGNSFALASTAYAKSISLMKIGIDNGR
jgi:flagellar basal-body rod protein FlgB